MVFQEVLLFNFSTLLFLSSIIFAHHHPLLIQTPKQQIYRSTKSWLHPHLPYLYPTLFPQTLLLPRVSSMFPFDLCPTMWIIIIWNFFSYLLPSSFLAMSCSCHDHTFPTMTCSETTATSQASSTNKKTFQLQWCPQKL